jgi:hypothetical protein
LKKIHTALRFLLRRRLKINSDIIQTKIKDFNYFIDKDNIKNYNDAVRNNDIASLIDDQNIHPLFYTKISWQIIESLNKYLDRPIDKSILKTIVHQSEHIIYHKSIKAPTDLTVKSRLWNLSKHKKGTKMLIRFDYYANKELVATEYSGGLLFGVKLLGQGKSLGKLPETKRIDQSHIWQETINIDKDLPYTYAKKAEIDAPIHTNPKFAKSIGLPDIILQGTCTFAKAVNLILLKELDNNPERIKSVAAKFTGMIVLPNKITVRLLKREKKLLYFDVTNNKNEAVIKGGEILL